MKRIWYILDKVKGFRPQRLYHLDKKVYQKFDDDNSYQKLNELVAKLIKLF